MNGTTLRLATVLIATLGVFGCGAQKGTTEMRWDANSPAAVSKATADGVYALYGPFDLNPMVKYTIRKGDPIGFKQADGKVFGVAGNNEFEIKTTMTRRTFYWKRESEK
jgi:hypothetical protein